MKTIRVPQKGDTGAKGDTGDTGAKGDTGDTGAKGDTGTPGTSSTSEPLNFYPAAIMDKTIIHNTSTLYNASSYQVQSIDTVNNIITINKSITLPDFEATKLIPYALTWQLHKKTLNCLDAHSILQLDQQISGIQFKYIIVSGQTEATVEANFAANSNVNFRNPNIVYKNLTNAPIAPASGSLPTVTRYPHTFYKDGVKFKMFGFYSDAATDAASRAGYSESTDMINWNTVSMMTFASKPAWMKTTLDTNNFYTGQTNVIIDNYYIVPYIVANNALNLRRVGLMKIPIGYNNSAAIPSANLSTNYLLSGNATYDVAGQLFVYASFVQFNDKLFICIDMYIAPRKVVIFEVTSFTDINNLTLTELQQITPDNVTGSWKKDAITNPSFFVYNNELFLNIHGVEIANSYTCPNVGNVNGLYIYDKTTKKFVEYFANPFLLNPYLNTSVTGAAHHGGVQQYLQDSNKLYSLTTFSAGTSTYKIFPIEMITRTNSEVTQWLIDNKL